MAWNTGRFEYNPIAVTSYTQRATPNTGWPITIKPNAKQVVLNTAAMSPGDDCLIYIGATRLQNFDLHLIADQCGLLGAGDLFYFNIGSERSRPNSGYIYAQFVAGFVGQKSVYYTQLVGNY